MFAGAARIMVLQKMTWTVPKMSTMQTRVKVEATALQCRRTARMSSEKQPTPGK